jgi:hypothetical protein
MCNDVVTILPTQLITVSKEDVKNLTTEEIQMLKNNTEMMRSNEEVMIIYLENLYWKRYKHAMVDNVISDKREKIQSEDPEVVKYNSTDPHLEFMMKNGCYVFSGSGLRFPEMLEDAKSPFDIKQPKKEVAFGATIKPHPAIALIQEARNKAKAKLAGSTSKIMKF